MTFNDGGPAFARPLSKLSSEEIELAQDGMSLRDYFAAQALAGWLASFDGGTRHPASVQRDDETSEAAEQRCMSLAKMSYALADAMLKAREAQS